MDPNQESPQAETPETPQESTPESSLDALSRGIDEAAPEVAEPDVAEEAAEEAAPETPEPEKAAEPEKPAEDDPAKGHTGKAAERIRELAAAKNELIAQVERYKLADERVKQWETMIQDTGATPEQYGSALGYLKAVNSGDPALMSQAFDAMQKEMAWLAKQLGREVPGVVDPLEDHPDLKAAIDEGEMTRKYALEVAQVRAQQQRSQQAQQAQQQRVQQQTAEQQAQAQVQQQLAALETRLKADPAYQAKMAQVDFDWIKTNVPADKWAAAVEHQFARAVIAPPPKPPVGHVPLRPAGRSANMAAIPKDSMEALTLGFQQAGAL